MSLQFIDTAISVLFFLLHVLLSPFTFASTFASRCFSFVSSPFSYIFSKLSSIAKRIFLSIKSSLAYCTSWLIIPCLFTAAGASYVTRIIVSASSSTIYYSAVEGFRSVLGLQRKMEPKADRLLQTLRDQNASMDAKVENLLAIKADIKQNNVPEDALPSLFDAIKLGISSNYTRYCGAAFSTLGNLVKRLSSQEQQRLIATFARVLYPVLLDRLGDQKERIRTHAFHAFVDFWPASQREVEEAVLGTALTGKNPRARQTAISWLLHMTKNHGLAFRDYVPDVIRCLQNADVSVRDTAKNTLVELFMDENDESKTFLKVELNNPANKPARQAIRDWILEQIGPFDEVPASYGMQQIYMMRERAIGRHEEKCKSDEKHLAFHEKRLARKEFQFDADKAFNVDALRRRLHLDESSNTDHSIAPRRQDPPRSKTPLAENALQLQRSAHTIPTWDEADVAPLIIRSSRQLEDIFTTMIPDFDGRETEKNWDKREKHVIILRQVVIGNAPRDYSQVFYPGIKAQLDNVFKAVLSLRTTLSSHGCYFVIDMARWLGPGIDGMVEIIVQNLFKVCVLSKKITAQNGNKAMIAVIANVSYNPRLLSHVQSATTDKSVQLRLFAAEWLRTIINRHTSIKAAIEHGNGLNLITTCIKKGLADANPNVRDEMRHTYWDFYVAWPAKANTIASDLDMKSRLLLDKNPHKPKEQQPGISPAEESSAPAPPEKSRSALKSAIAAQRRAHHLKAKAVEESPAVAGPSTLHSAPVRPRFRRPEGDRPASAELHAPPAAPLTPFDRDVDQRSPSDDWKGLAKFEPKKPRLVGGRFTSRAKPVVVGQGDSGEATKAVVAGRQDDINDTDASVQRPIESISGVHVDDSHVTAQGPTESMSEVQIDDSHVTTQGPAEITSGVQIDDSHVTAQGPTKSMPEVHIDDSHVTAQGPTKSMPEVQIDDSHVTAQGPAEITSGVHVDDSHVTAQGPTKSMPEVHIDDSHVTAQGPTKSMPEVHIDDSYITARGPAEIMSERQRGKMPMREVGQRTTSTSLENMVVFDPLRIVSLSKEPDFRRPTSPADSGRILCMSQSGEIYDKKQSARGPSTPAHFPPTDPHLAYLLASSPSEPPSDADWNFDDSLLSENFLWKDFNGESSSPREVHGIIDSRVADEDISWVEEIRGERKKDSPQAMDSAQMGQAQTVHEVPQASLIVDPDPRSTQELPLMQKQRWPVGPRCEPAYERTPEEDLQFAGALLERSEERSNRRAPVSSSPASQNPNRMDPHGFRRLRRVLESSDETEISQEQQHELVLALLNTLERGHPTVKSAPDTALLPVLDVLEHTIKGREGEKKRFTPKLYYLTTISFLETRGRYDASCYFAVRLDEVATRIVHAELGEALRHQNASGLSLAEDIVLRIGSLVSEQLEGVHAEVRRLVVQVCVHLHAMVKEDRFWELLGTTSTGSRNLLTYYLARG
ncbi:suppressor of tub2 mutation [Aspergillus melleus]|uniref:Suppressor of tub2 mutation n=1 Tax=Aspergillus melleus TaxID=138277 RepID=A0ACC3ALH7_9EURO|nr:suppressor of tub2 mutation [Aspergillus melleus]